jgi:RNA polymerase sigma-70 factor (ECF subfamily)
VYYINETEDAALIQQCLAGDQAAFETIVRRYQRGLFNVALRMLGSYEDARDSTQNAFVKAYEHLDGFDPTQRFFNWIYRILKNECLNVLRARRPSEPVSPDFPSIGGPADSLESDERQRAVQAALLMLPADYREVIVLRHFTELSYEDIAITLGIPVKTVKSRLYTARRQLGELLIEWRIA